MTSTSSAAIGQNSVANEANTVSVGSSDNQRRITNVADGVNETDAVNFRQLTSSENRLSKKVTSLKSDAFSGIAAVAALAAIPAPAPGRHSSIGIGYGNYKGENAIAVGYKADITESLQLSAGLAHSNSDVTTNVGVGWSW